MSFAAGFLNAWKDNEATAERERLQQEAKDARESALAITAQNRQEDQDYRASRDAKLYYLIVWELLLLLEMPFKQVRRCQQVINKT